MKCPGLMAALYAGLTLLPSTRVIAATSPSAAEQVLFAFDDRSIPWRHKGAARLYALYAQDDPRSSDKIVRKWRTESGIEFGVWGRRDGERQPTLIVLASTIQETLGRPYYRQCGNRLVHESGWLCVSIDLPCHGEQRRDGESAGLTGWRKRVEAGEDFVSEFNQRLSTVLDHLIANGYTDPRRIAACGTSRGGFLATHFTAADHRVACVVGFAPVTDLAKLSEFQGMEKDTLTRKLSLANLAEALTGRWVLIGIGDQDQRVSTDAAIDFARKLTIARSRVQLHVFSEPRGHTTPNGFPELAADWIHSVFRPEIAEPNTPGNGPATETRDPAPPSLHLKVDFAAPTGKDSLAPR